MENNNNAAKEKSEEQNPSNSNLSSDRNGDPVVAKEAGAASAAAAVSPDRSLRTPFTNLSQVDSDLALARTLQEQERAYMMLRMNSDGIGYRTWEASGFGYEDGEAEDFDEYDGSNIDDDDAFDVHAHEDEEEEEEEAIEIDPSAYSSDEAYARALQDAEEREVANRLMALAGLNEEFVGESEDDEADQDDELSYEELIALGEVVGTESRGLSPDIITSLPTMKYKLQTTEEGNTDSCVICRCEYEDEETLTVLSCKHSYHSECINNWLQQNKVCPICNAEVSTSGNC